MIALALGYNQGTSGGSWIADFCNTHPRVCLIEEWNRKEGHPKVGFGGMTRKGLHDMAFGYLQGLEAQAPAHGWQTVGLIKGFGQRVLDYALERGARITAQYKHPVRVLWAQRKRIAQPRAWIEREEGAARDPRDYAEFFTNQCKYKAHQYWIYWKRRERHRLVKLEDLSASIMGDRSYIRELLSWWHQLEWTSQDIDRAVAKVKPRHRGGCKGDECWQEHWEANANVPWNNRYDPPKEEIWASWKPWQHRLFLAEFGEIMTKLGYSTDWMGI
jgi:hypothetical protein